MLKQLQQIEKNFLENLEKIENKQDLEELQNNILWKKWSLKNLLKWIKDLSVEEKKEIWQKVNKLKDFILEKITEKNKFIEQKEFLEIWEKEAIDVTASFPSDKTGHFHPISMTSKLLEEIFISMWFKIADWPQVENEDFNFDKLNIPDNHPARDVWDTFWLDDFFNAWKKSGEKLLLRTHTSPVQIREMLKSDLPLKIIVPGRVFRYEQEDARHTSNFYQLEWLVIWKNISLGNLKWTLQTAMKKLLWEKTQIRLRPSIFPFTEPSAEIDISCQICSWTWKKWNDNCKMCSGTGWVELLWAWMVHPKVLSWVWINPEKYSWFAFWMWIDRIAAQRFWVNSSRMFYQNKFKLLRQF